MADTEITPLVVSIEIPATVGEIVNFHGVVPPPLVKAVEVSARPKVVKRYDWPPPIVSGPLTKIVIKTDVVAPTESVTVIVSGYVPATTELSAVTMPVWSIVMPLGND